jgi:hypothetical protein
MFNSTRFLQSKIQCGVEDMRRIYIIPEGMADKGEKPGEEKEKK